MNHMLYDSRGNYSPAPDDEEEYDDRYEPDPDDSRYSKYY